MVFFQVRLVRRTWAANSVTERGCISPVMRCNVICIKATNVNTEMYVWCRCAVAESVFMNRVLCISVGGSGTCVKNVQGNINVRRIGLGLLRDSASSTLLLVALWDYHSRSNCIVQVWDSISMAQCIMLSFIWLNLTVIDFPFGVFQNHLHM